MGPAHSAGGFRFINFWHPFSFFFVPNFGSIFDVVVGSQMDHFWSPKCAQMSPNGDPQMCLHNDVSKNQFLVILWPIFDLVNTRK